MTQPVSPDFLETKLLPRLKAATAYRPVAFDGPGRRYLRARCPWAGAHSAATFVVDAATLRWTCLDHCRRGGQSLLAYFNGGRFPRAGSGELKAALEKAASLAGIAASALPELTPEAEQAMEQQERVASLLETFLIQSQGALQPASAKRQEHEAAVAFLAEHGFNLQGLDDLPIGFVTGLDAVRRGLEQTGYSAQEIEASALVADERLAGRLVGPVRDSQGRILSFWARDPRDRPPRLLFKGPWKEQIALIGLDAACPAADAAPAPRGAVVVFERLLDSLLLHTLGFERAAAIAGPAMDMSQKRWERLAGLGVRRVILVPDATDSSCKGVWIAIESALRAKSAPAVEVLLPEALRGYPSAVALVRARGPGEFQSLLETSCVHALRFQACWILRSHRRGAGWTEAARHAAWKRAIEYYATAERHHLAALDAHFVPAIVEGLGRKWDTFEPIGQDIGAEQALWQTASEPAPAEPPTIPEVAVESRPAPELTPEPPSRQGRQAPSSKGAPTRNGTNGYCRIHQCDSTYCFCFD